MKTYVVVLGPGASDGNPLLQTFKMPVPRFGHRCVCCYAESGGLARALVPDGASVWVNEGIPVPVCRECLNHVTLNSSRGAALPAQLAFSFLGLLLLAITVFMDRFAPLMLVLTLLVLVPTALWIGLGARASRRRVAAGHHRFGFSARYQTEIETTNREFARDLLERNPWSTCQQLDDEEPRAAAG